MRHRKKINHLSRKSAHRKSMLANMASSLIIHKRINTTLAKAKALRTYVEPLITKSKEDTTHSRRVVFSYLQDKDAVNELFREVSVKVAERPGGYTRIIKTGARLGDSAEMCMMELVDFNENLLGAKGAETGKSTRRRRRGGSAKKTTTAEAKATSKARKEAEEKPEEKAGDAVEDTAVVETPTEQPEAKAEEPEAKATEPEAKSEEPEDKVTEPEAKAEKPEEKVDEPKAEAEEPEVKAEEQSSATDEKKVEDAGSEEKGKDEETGDDENKEKES